MTNTTERRTPCSGEHCRACVSVGRHRGTYRAEIMETPYVHPCPGLHCAVHPPVGGRR